MAYNFLELVNEVNGRLNEPPLTESNFVSAAGFYTTAKNAVNSAVSEINSAEYQWSFNHNTGTIILQTDGRIRYPIEDNVKIIDYDTFRVLTAASDFDPDDFDPEDFLTVNTTSQNTRWLRPISYDEFISQYVRYEYNTASAGIPSLVFEAQDRSIGIIPAAKAKYAVKYEYWGNPDPMVTYDDAPAIPEAFKYVIIEGAMFYAYMFREEEQKAMISREMFKEGISKMRNLYINKFTKVVAKTRVP